jgi:hypothetical protein
MTRYHGEVKNIPERHLRGVVESLRLHHFQLNSTWHPPGLAQAFAPPCREGISGKRAADALEALIGIVYESVGLDGISDWLSSMYLLPKRDRVRATEATPAKL